MEEYESEASATDETAETCMRDADASDLPVYAPPPFDAHHRRLRAGADTSPTTTSGPSISAMSVAQTGTPRTKLRVASIGSSTQRRGPHPVSSPSSPCTASRGRVRERLRRINSSTATSASLTSVMSGFTDTRRSCALNRAIVSESALSASTWARRRSSTKDWSMAAP